MKAIVISLPHAHERRKRASQRFAEIGLSFEFLDAVDAGELTDADIVRMDARYRRRWGLRPLAATELACWLSHVRAIHQASIGSDEVTAIFEDDAMPRPECTSVLTALEHCLINFDLVSLGRRNTTRAHVDVHALEAGRSLCRVRFSEYGAFGYVITKEAALRLGPRLTRMRVPIDMDLMFFWVHRLNLWFLDTPVVDHDDDVPSYLTADRERMLVGWKPSRLRRIAYRLHMAVAKRIGFRRLVQGRYASKQKTTRRI